MGSDQNRSGAKEQGDLPNGMGRDVNCCPCDTCCVSQDCAEHHIRKLADGRVGQPPFEIVLAQGDQRRADDSDRCNPKDRGGGAGTRQQVQAEYINRDFENREDTRFDDSDCVQQSAHRRWCNHGRR